MEWMLLPLKRYADFTGRSRRREYWMFVLGYSILAVILTVLYFSVGSGIATAVLALGGLLAMGLFVPALAVQVRRFHDQDRSGWFVLLGFIPYVGGIVVLVFMCLPGTVGPNRYGDDPKGGHLGDVFA